MKRQTITCTDELVITNDVHLDAEGEPLFEEVTCETGSFPILRLVASEGRTLEDDE